MDKSELKTSGSRLKKVEIDRDELQMKVSGWEGMVVAGSRWEWVRVYGSGWE